MCISNYEGQKSVFCIVFCIWMTSSSIHICTLKQHSMSTCRQNNHRVEVENAISNCETFKKANISINTPDLLWHVTWLTFNMKCDMTWYVIWHVAWHVIWNVTGYSKTWHDMLNDRLHDVTLHDMAQHGMTWDNIHTGSYPNLGGTCRFCHSSEGGTLRYFQ